VQVKRGKVQKARVTVAAEMGHGLKDKDREEEGMSFMWNGKKWGILGALQVHTANFFLQW
jgi:hypothetical protein